MGRGRQKAKQTKVARRLKYFSPDTDYDALQRELSSGDAGQAYASDDSDDVDEAEVDDDPSEDDEYADWNPRGRH
ncbi:MAG TPA: DUF3073 domain-containing protein [Kineosporiaceae bacterium]|nr:DUF3073 domain-containing protein [Kineosporiaceae bacterium]